MQILEADTRFTVTLNIGLDNNPLASFSPLAQVEEILETARRRGSFLAGVVKDTTIALRREDPEGEEPFLIVELDIEAPSENYAFAYVETLCLALCFDMTQDAIAAHVADTQSDREIGYMFGPRADNYGPFDADRFTMLDARLVDAWSQPA